MVFRSEGGEGKTFNWLLPGMNENVCYSLASRGFADMSQGLLCHRSDVYEELKRLATGEGEGPPAQLHLGTQVVACDPEEGTVTLNGGKVVQADFILGADGVHVGTRPSYFITVLTIFPVRHPQSCFRKCSEGTRFESVMLPDSLRGVEPPGHPRA